jgi:hypothetical protein
MDWAKIGSEAKQSTSTRLGTTRDLRIIRSSPFTSSQKGPFPQGTNSSNYTRRNVLINFIKGHSGEVYGWAGWVSVPKRETKKSRIKKIQ